MAIFDTAEIQGRNLRCYKCRTDEIRLVRVCHTDEDTAEYNEVVSLHYKCDKCSETFFQIYGLLPPVG